MMSDAILEGSKNTKQAFRDMGNSSECCALGAAYLIRYGTANPGGRVVKDIHVDCPECGCSCKVMDLEAELEVIGTISHLNDTHRWSREDIAEWLRSSGNDYEIGDPDASR